MDLDKILQAYDNYEKTTNRKITDEEKKLIRFGYVTAMIDLIGKDKIENAMFGK